MSESCLISIVFVLFFNYNLTFSNERLQTEGKYLCIIYLSFLCIFIYHIYQCIPIDIFTYQVYACVSNNILGIYHVYVCISIYIFTYHIHLFICIYVFIQHIYLHMYFNLYILSYLSRCLVSGPGGASRQTVEDTRDTERLAKPFNFVSFWPQKPTATLHIFRNPTQIFSTRDQGN